MAKKFSLALKKFVFNNVVMDIKLTELICSLPSEYVMTADRSGCLQYDSPQNKSIWIERWSNGCPAAITYWKDDLMHRPFSEGPAQINWHKNGQIWSEEYIENGKFHRPSSEGPAYQEWDKDGNLQEVSYYENGKHHRPSSEGPARQFFSEGGRYYEFASYYENGKEVSKP